MGSFCVFHMSYRSRRRRARENLAIKDHHEGLSTDDEENQSEITKFRVARGQLVINSRKVNNSHNKREPTGQNSF